MKSMYCLSTVGCFRGVLWVTLTKDDIKDYIRKDDIKVYLLSVACRVVLWVTLTKDDAAEVCCGLHSERTISKSICCWLLQSCVVE